MKCRHINPHHYVSYTNGNRVHVDQKNPRIRKNLLNFSNILIDLRNCPGK